MPRLRTEHGIVGCAPVEFLDAPKLTVAVGEPAAHVARERPAERSRVETRRPPRTARLREDESLLAAKEAAARA